MMNWLYILAQNVQVDRYEGLRKSFINAKEDAVDFRPIIMVAVGVTIFGLFIYTINKFRMGVENRGATRRPMKMLNRVLKGLGVGFLDRAVMRFAALHSELPHPAIGLLSNELFERHFVTWAEEFNVRPIRGFLRRRLAVVSQKAFAS